jgi:hypothetical protein
VGRSFSSAKFALNPLRSEIKSDLSEALETRRLRGGIFARNLLMKLKEQHMKSVSKIGEKLENLEGQLQRELAAFERD